MERRQKMYRAGIDLGGTNIKAGIIDDNQKILVQASVPTKVERDYTEIIRDMAGLVGKLTDELSISVEELAGVQCKGCPYRRMKQHKKVVIHLEDDLGYETERKVYEDPDDEGILYDNLD